MVDGHNTGIIAILRPFQTPFLSHAVRPVTGPSPDAPRNVHDLPDRMLTHVQ